MSGSRADRADTAHWLWDAVERSDGGHERRRRVGWRMTEEQARFWELAHGGKLVRAEKCAVPTKDVRPSGRVRS